MNGDGRLSWDELASVLRMTATTDEIFEFKRADLLAGVFHDIDIDGDGFVSMQEFLQGIKARPWLVRSFLNPSELLREEQASRTVSTESLGIEAWLESLDISDEGGAEAHPIEPAGREGEEEEEEVSTPYDVVASRLTAGGGEEAPSAKRPRSSWAAAVMAGAGGRGGAMADDGARDEDPRQCALM